MEIEKKEKDEKEKKSVVITLKGTISKGELANAYYPNLTRGSALNALNKDFENNADLMKELEKANYKKRCHILTIYQTKIIFKYLGNPFDPEWQQNSISL